MASVSRVPLRQERPPGAVPSKIWWPYAIGIGGMHLLALLALWPWLFSWSGVAAVLIGHHLFGMLGMTVGYHRLLTHRSFQCPRWLERTLAILGVCCLQDTPARWVATHRLHHQHSDQAHDPHSPLVNFMWGQMGWLMVNNRDVNRLSHLEKYAKDLMRDPFYMWLERSHHGLLVFGIHVVAIFALGAGIGWLSGGGPAEVLRMGLSLLVWGVAVRTVFVWHVTWAVNSLTHLWGYQTYATSDNSRNNWLVGLLAHGEGWHNNHHALPTAAAHGRRWWEFDLSYRVICFWERIGLAWNVARPELRGQHHLAVDNGE